MTFLSNLTPKYLNEESSHAYSGEVDQGSGVMPISVPVDSDQVIGAERRWQGDCVGSDRNRQEEVGERKKREGLRSKATLTRC